MSTPRVDDPSSIVASSTTDHRLLCYRRLLLVRNILDRDQLTFVEVFTRIKIPFTNGNLIKKGGLLEGLLESKVMLLKNITLKNKKPFLSIAPRVFSIFKSISRQRTYREHCCLGDHTKRCR